MVVHERAVYATQPAPLRSQIDGLLKTATPTSIEGDIFAIIVPDSNLLSGGTVAAQVYKTLDAKQYDTVVLIAPSHTGAFRRISICSIDAYRTPLGDLEVSDKVRNELCDEDDDIFLDDTGHYHTAGIDVQLPFLQTLFPTFDIVPVVMGEESPEFCKELGSAVGEVMYNQRTLVVACVDIEEGTEEDLEKLQTYLKEHDVSRLMSMVNSEQVKLHGKGAMLVALIASLHRRANSVEVLQMQAPQGSAPGFIGAVLARR